MPINRRIFFDKIRLDPFRGALAPQTVNGCSAILDEWERRGLRDLRWLADMLATARGECGPNMLPVREGFASSDDAARAYVNRQGYRYAKEVNGHVYYGRGLVQLTWDYNYKKMGDLLNIDLVNNPDEALKPHVAAAIMFEGMIRGTFTGKKLADYFNATVTDWINARRIINGTDKAAQFAAWARSFHAALTAASDVAAPSPDVEPVPPKPQPKPANIPGAGGAIVGTGATVIVADQAQKRGASTAEIATFIICGLLVSVAAFFILRNWWKK